MRKTNINQTITRADVKKGDKVRIEREITVTDIRVAQLGRINDAQIVTANGNETLALTPKETVTLLERDQSLDFGEDAKVVTWTVESEEETEEDTDKPEDYFAVRIQGQDGWISSDEDTYSDDEELEADILNGDFGEYVEGTFKVLSPKPKLSLASGGFVRGGFVPTSNLTDTRARMSQAAGRRAVVGSSLSGYIGR